MIKVYIPPVPTQYNNTTRTKAAHVNITIITVPQQILDVYKNVTLYLDILFIGTFILFSSISKKVLRLQLTTQSRIKKY